MKTTSDTEVTAEKHFSSSILLWMRTDKPREVGMEYWKGPHSKIIAATKGLEEYRQVHLADDNTGLWPPIDGVETVIPADRRIDGIAEVTLKSPLSPLWGRKQTKLAFQDEVNVFRRTILYGGLPNSSRWYELAQPDDAVEARSLIYVRRREGVKDGDFRKFINHELVPALANTGVLKELRSQVFMPWIEKLWDTPNVAHDNPTEVRFHASLILGFASRGELEAFFGGDEIKKLSDKLSAFSSAIHAYDVSEALTFVKEGKVLRHYLK